MWLWSHPEPSGVGGTKRQGTCGTGQRRNVSQLGRPNLIDVILRPARPHVLSSKFCGGAWGLARRDESWPRSFGVNGTAATDVIRATTGIAETGGHFESIAASVSFVRAFQ